MNTSKRVEANEMPSRPMNAEPSQPTGGGSASSLVGEEMPNRPMSAEPAQPTGAVKAPSSHGEEMPTRAMDEPQSNIPSTSLSHREQDKLAAYRRDQAARAAAGTDEKPSGT